MKLQLEIASLLQKSTLPDGSLQRKAKAKYVTTNEGPKVKLDKTSLSMTVDASKAPTASAAFNITNKGKGMLKYELTAATTKAIMSTKARAEKPSPGQVVCRQEAVS